MREETCRCGRRVRCLGLQGSHCTDYGYCEGCGGIRGCVMSYEEKLAAAQKPRPPAACPPARLRTLKTMR